MDLRPGDIFCTVNPMWLGRAICAVQRFWDPDGEADFSHAGVITCGFNTFEARWQNGRYSLNDYIGERVLVGRHESMDYEAFLRGWQQIYHLEGRFYAGHRLLLHLFPPLARMVASGGFAVCSEIVAKFLAGAGVMTRWSGIAPDYLSDMMTQHKGWTVVFDGALPPRGEICAPLPQR